jgi:hypothetical protein
VRVPCPLGRENGSLAAASVAPNFASLTSSIASEGNLAFSSTSSAAIAVAFTAACRRGKEEGKEETEAARYSDTFLIHSQGSPNNLPDNRGLRGLSIVAAVEDGLITLKIVGGNSLGDHVIASATLTIGGA